MPQQTRMVWKAKVTEPAPATPPKNEDVRARDDREKGKGKGKSKQELSTAERWKGDRSEGAVDRSWERRQDNKFKEVVAKGSSDSRGKQNEGKGGKSKAKSKDDANQQRPKEDDSARRKGGKSKGGFDSGSKGGRGKGSSSNPGNAKTVQELESEMARKRDYEPTKQPLEADGKSCQVKKHSGMGCAVITMPSGEIRDTVLMRARQRHKGVTPDPVVVEIAGIDVQVKPHTDKATKLEIKTDIFAAWGHQIEKQTPLEASSIATFFDDLYREVSEARASHIPMRGSTTLSTVPPLAPAYSPHQTPPPPPAHAPKVGQLLSQSAAFAQPQATPQNPAPLPSAFPDQQYEYWLRQQQQQQYVAHMQQQYAEQYAALQASQQAQQQQQYSMAQQQYYQDQLALQQQTPQAQADYVPVGKTPKPLQIKDPRTGSVIDTLGMNFKKNEGSSPQKIIDPNSGELVSPEKVARNEVSETVS